MKPLLSLNIEDKKSFQTQKAPKLRVPAVFSHHVLQIELEEAESKGLKSCLGASEFSSECSDEVLLSIIAPAAALPLLRATCGPTDHALSGKSAAVGKAHSWVLVILFLLRICRRIHLLWGSCFSYIHEIEFPWEESSSFAS